MKHTVTIYTDKDDSDSIRQEVKIAFTMTPLAPTTSKQFDPHPIAYEIMEFRPGGSHNRKLEWHTELGFSACTRKTEHKIKPEEHHCHVPPKHYVDLVETTHGCRWTRTKPDKNTQRQRENMIIASNWTREQRMMALGFLKPSTDSNGLYHGSFHPLSCYTINAADSLFVPASLELQAYVVDMKDRKNQLLLPQHRKHPIFSEPLKCDSLGQKMRWKLTQDGRGVYQLTQEHDDDPSETRELLNSTVARVGRAEGRLDSLESGVGGQDDFPMPRPPNGGRPKPTPMPSYERYPPHPSFGSGQVQTFESHPGRSPSVTSGGSGSSATVWTNANTPKGPTSSYQTFIPGRAAYS